MMYISPMPVQGRFPTNDAPEIKPTDKFKITDAVCDQRLRIGEIHERIGLPLGPSCPLHRDPG